jgi:MFS family permease
MGAPLGLLISTAFLILSEWISGDAFMDWGWRLPFLVSAVLFLLGLYIRLSVTESKIFEEVKEQQGVSQAPIIEVFRTSKKPLCIASMLGALNNITWMTWATFSISYVVIKGVPKGDMFNYVCIGAVASILSIMFWAAVSDKFGRRPLIIACVIFTIAMAFPFYWILDTKSAIWIPVGLCVMTFIHAMSYGPQAAFFSEMFEPRVRYTGASMATAIASAVFGGTAPLIQTALLAYAGGASWAVSTYYVAIAVVTLIALLFAKETHKSDISITGYAKGEVVQERAAKG